MIGESVIILGGGRSKKGDKIDHDVGVEIHHKVGDHLEKGETLFTVHANDQASLEQARSKLLEAHAWSDQPVDPLPLFYGVIL
jgi:pyrimidine-nucleoside phosphorylase